MVNGLVDFGVGGGVGVYAGGGFGRAHVKALGDSDNAWAWQLLAGVYAPISDNIDVGLKYRYFRTGHLNFNDNDAFVAGHRDLRHADLFGRNGLLLEQWPVQLAQRSRQPDVQLRWRRCGSAAAPAASAASAAAPGSGDADLPGRLGDPGDECLPGPAASASPAAAGSEWRARPLRAVRSAALSRARQLAPGRTPVLPGVSFSRRGVVHARRSKLDWRRKLAIGAARPGPGPEHRPRQLVRLSS